MTEISSVQCLPDEFFAMESQLAFSYRFIDKNGKQIPNEFGFQVIRYLKSNCVDNGRIHMFFDEVRPILAEYSREELAQLLADNGNPWLPPVLPKKGKKIEDEY